MPICTKDFRLGSILVVAILLAAPRDGRADARDDAKIHFQRGVALYKDSDFRAALIEFQRAYQAVPNYKLLYNIGQASLELQDYAGALSAFRRFLADGGREVSPDRRKQVEAELRRLEARVARLLVRSDADDAEILVDDVPVGRTPLSAPVLVGAGRRRVSLHKIGLPPVTRTLDLAGGDETSVDIMMGTQKVITEPAPVGAPSSATLSLASTSTPGEPAAESASLRGGGPSTWTWVGIATTGTLALGTAIVGSAAIVSKSDWDRAVSAFPGDAEKTAAAGSRTQALAAATDVLLVATGVAAVSTFVLALTTRAPVRPGTAELRFGPAWIGVGGRF
jgi:hypothetical protein